MMPTNLVLVRHGESESNVANAHSRDGDGSMFTPEFSNRHTSAIRLTDRGIQQAKAAGRWLKEQNLDTFFRYYVSEYARAIETAGYLNLSGANWYTDNQLRERERGMMEHLPDDVRRIKFKECLDIYDRHHFYGTYPNGESMADVCNRIRCNTLDTLHRECSDKDVIIVAHGEVIWAFRIILERISANEYNKLEREKSKWFKIGNGQIVHYTRVDPYNPSNILPRMGWVRSINPYDPEYAGHDWKEIPRRKTYSNDELLEMANQFPRIISG